jgi:3-vinyl bacteriochlorophyllide hydratase
MQHRGAPHQVSPLYTAEQRRRRDASRWTRVQGVLAPLQFLAFFISFCLIARFLSTGHGEAAATISIIVKTLLLYAIMITGCFWERDVFGRFLFAKAFFWEDVVSMAVLALHSAYLAALFSHRVEIRDQMFIALGAYAAYSINATQFLLKFRAARRDGRSAPDSDLSVAIAVQR